jgi:ParB-like chromosome segregation protein Spo0J
MRIVRGWLFLVRYDEARDDPNRDIYVPTKRRATLEQKRVDAIAASILDKGLQAPILVRADGARFVLVEGLHRLEAAKALGDHTIVAFLVDARKH